MIIECVVFMNSPTRSGIYWPRSCLVPVSVVLGLTTVKPRVLWRLS
jgi:hypothetical protein